MLQATQSCPPKKLANKQQCLGETWAAGGTVLLKENYKRGFKPFAALTTQHLTKIFV